MAKVDEPIFDEEDGEIDRCINCPIDDLDIDDCYDWRRTHGFKCPTAETYQEACDLAEKEAHK